MKEKSRHSPAIEWLDAPDWAALCVVDRDGTRHWKEEDWIGHPDQTIEARPPQPWFDLMRAERESAEPDSEGWVAWLGGECPLLDGTLHEVKLSGGGLPESIERDNEPSSWNWSDDHRRIIAYRVIEPASDEPSKGDLQAEAVSMSHCEDALQWAEFFIRTVDRIGRDKIDTDLMLGWFANAIEGARNADMLDKEPCDEPADDGVLSRDELVGVERADAIRDALIEGKKSRAFEYLDPESFDWQSCPDWDTAVYAKRVRRKPRLCHLIDANGVRHEFPEPMRSEPAAGTPLWVACDTTSPDEPWEWRPDLVPEIVGWLEGGFCHATREARDAHERALIAASGGQS